MKQALPLSEGHDRLLLQGNLETRNLPEQLLTFQGHQALCLSFSIDFPSPVLPSIGASVELSTFQVSSQTEQVKFSREELVQPARAEANGERYGGFGEYEDKA